MGSFSIWHWLIVLLIVVVVFGTKKLRNIGQDLGGAVKDFREGVRSAEAPPVLPAATPPPADPTIYTTADDRTHTVQAHSTSSAPVPPRPEPPKA